MIGDTPVTLGERARTSSGVGRGAPGWQMAMYVENSDSRSTNSRVRRSPICEKIQQIAERISSKSHLNALARHP